MDTKLVPEWLDKKFPGYEGHRIPCRYAGLAGVKSQYHIQKWTAWRHCYLMGAMWEAARVMAQQEPSPLERGIIQMFSNPT